MLNQTFAAEIQQLKQLGLHRKRILADSSQEKNLINFSSSDYLSLANDHFIKAAFQRGFALYPTGGCGSMVVCGYYSVHKELEQAFAKALKADDALLFSSGYSANVAVISLLARVNSHFFIDKAAHASIYDGLRFAGANYRRFLHNNLEDLARKLANPSDNRIIFAESIFSMSGQMTNLRAASDLAKQYNAECIVDEAHAIGVLGPAGMGAVAHHGLNQEEVPLRIIPFGKAFAAQGAIVVGKKEWIDSLLQISRSYVYSTAFSPALAYGLLESLAFIQKAEDRRKKLSHLIAHFKQLTNQSFLNWRPSNSPIQQLQLGCAHKALKYVNILRENGIFCQAMREPTVTKKETGLRIVLNSHHEPEQIDYLFLKLQQIQ